MTPQWTQLRPNVMRTKPEPKTQAARVAAYRERRKTRSVDIDGETFERLTEYKDERGLTISEAIGSLLDIDAGELPT